MGETGVEAVVSLAVALGIGLLLGAERERSQTRRGPRGVAGIRTFALVALLGAVAERVGGTPVVAVGFAVIGAAALVGYIRSDRSDVGLTTEVAMLVAFLLGVLSQDEPAIASALAVTVTILLATRTALHRFVGNVLTDTEVHDALLFAAAAAVILPLMPDRPVGPLDTVNPFAVWRLVVLLMGISAAGYIATRALGPRSGLPMAGLLGGFVSSTATIGSMGSTARREPGLIRSAISAALLSTVATIVQMAAILSVASLATLHAMRANLLAAGLAAVVVAAAFALSARLGDETLHTDRHSGGHAFDLRAAVLLAMTITAVTFAGGLASELAGDRGVAAAAFMGGFADAHAAAIAIASLVSSGQLSAGAAVVPVLLGLTSNTGSKMVFAYASGGRRFAAPVWGGLLAVIVAAWLPRLL